MVRDGKPKGFFYLDHRTVDGRHAIITDTHVTPANVHDSVPYLGRLDRQRERFGFHVRAVGSMPATRRRRLRKGLEERDIYGVTGYRSPNHRGRLLPQTRSFATTTSSMSMSAPTSQLLIYRTTNREGYRQYHSDARAVPRVPAAPAVHAQPQRDQDRDPPRLGGQPGPDRSAPP